MNLMSFSSSHFGRYVSQTEHCMDELNGTNDWNQQQQQPPSINDIPPLMSITTIAPIQRVPAPIVKEKLESLPFPQHAPGPIQRPTKLACSMSVPQQPSSSSSSFLTDSVLSPNTPDVLDQINRLLDHQNSTTTPSLTPVPIISSNLTNNPTVSSTIISGLTTPNVQWTHFSSNEWPSKYDSSWPLSSIQSPPVTLATHTQNPFALAATNTDVNSNSTTQQQVPREESSVWSSVLGTITPRPTSSSTRTQRAATWNELFSAAVPSSPEPSLSIKPTTSTGENNSNAPWLKFWQAPDPSSGGGTPSSNGPDNDTTGPFWNPLEAINLGSLSTVPTSIVRNPLPEQSLPSTTSVNWWPAPSADENNNNNSSNNTTTKNTTDDTAANNRDQSRWDFAR
jgi:hypothetical protein